MGANEVIEFHAETLVIGSQMIDLGHVSVVSQLIKARAIP
jgi:hypothetical protein